MATMTNQRVLYTAMKVALPPDVAIDAEIDLCVTEGEYSLEARLSR